MTRLSPGDHFSPRESDLLRLLLEGHANKEIGAQLGLSTNTIKAYLVPLMVKVNLDNRTKLALYAQAREFERRIAATWNILTPWECSSLPE